MHNTQYNTIQCDNMIINSLDGLYLRKWYEGQRFQENLHNKMTTNYTQHRP